MTNTEKRLVLASSSPRRRVLLAEGGYSFEVIASDVDESLPAGLSPEDAAVEVARRKALAVAAEAAGAVVLAADTIVVTSEGEVLGKPDTPDDARRMLGCLCGTTHRVITGVFILDTAAGRSLGRAVSTTIVFGEMSPGRIEEYVASGEAMGKAGAYAIQETGDRFVREVRGSFSNVVGLPMEAVGEMLDDLDAPAATGATEQGEQNDTE
ncbi:MAG: septum formation protein Maf [Planctomycetes bacterium]|nr:septum formation protein Maf [Planctomycetota bacterium]